MWWFLSMQRLRYGICIVLKLFQCRILAHECFLFVSVCCTFQHVQPDVINLCPKTPRTSGIVHEIVPDVRLSIHGWMHSCNNAQHFDSIFGSAADMVSKAYQMPSRMSMFFVFFFNQIGSLSFYTICLIFGLYVHKNIDQKPVISIFCFDFLFKHWCS